MQDEARYRMTRQLFPVVVMALPSQRKSGAQYLLSLIDPADTCWRLEDLLCKVREADLLVIRSND